PLTEAAARAADVSFYRKIPGAQKVVQQMQQAPGPNSRGIRLPSYAAVHAILNEETAAALNGKKPPMKAQADAVKRSSAAMSGKGSVAGPIPAWSHIAAAGRWRQKTRWPACVWPTPTGIGRWSSTSCS